MTFVIPNIDISKYPVISNNVLDTFPIFLDISFQITLYWYMTINFLGPENYLKISVVWDELRI